jgi:putative ABC transport system permease protein
MFRNYVKVAWRGLKKNRMVAVINVFGLSIGLVCCMLTVLFIDSEQRSREIGIRKVLGATVPALVGLLAKDFMRLVVFALIIAGPVAWLAMNKWLQGFTERIPIPWTVFALTTGLVLVIAFSTICFCTIRAALANPVRSLKSE